MADEQADWRASQAHDADAFARIFDRHRDAVFRQALRVMRQPADAEEVASAAFFELWRKRASVQLVGGSVRPWLLVTAMNLARNSHRSRLRHEVFLRRLEREWRDDSGLDAFARIDDAVDREDLIAALKRLSPQDAALVTMTALDGYRASEIAGLLGISAGTARVRLSRALARLRGLLTPVAEAHTGSQEVAR